MDAANDPEIVLYDLACTKNVCFSPVVWRIRLMLNYKRIPYKTVFLEFPDIEPTLKQLGLKPPSSARYTVPAIHHVPTNMYMMDSAPIAQFLEKTYPQPPLPLTSEPGREIESKARGVVGTVLRSSIMPREINILCPRTQEFFRKTREAALGHRLEDFLDAGKEEEAWNAAENEMREVGELMRANHAAGPFVLGSHPSLTDFFISGSLQTTRVVDEKVFERLVAFPGYGEVYKACQPWMKRQD